MSENSLTSNLFPPKQEGALINILRIPLAIGIVLLHSPFPGKFGNFFSYHYLFNGIVPLFFMISGYLFFGRVPSKISYQWYIHLIRKKIFSLLIPYLSWVSFAILIVAIQHSLHLYHNQDIVLISDWRWREWLEAYGIISGQPRAFALWFLQDLMLCFLVSPLLIWLLKHLKIWLLPVIIVMFFFQASAICLLLRYWDSIALFLLGGMIAQQNPDFVKHIKISIAPFLFCTVFALFSLSSLACGYLRGLTTLFSIGFWLVLGKILMSFYPRTFFPKAAALSFFIYCAHGPFGGILLKAMGVIHLPLSPCFKQALYIICLLTSCTVCFYITEKIKILTFLFSGRSSK